MYKANSVDRNWFKEMAITAILKNIFNALLHWRDYEEFSIEGREYDAMCTYEFADDYKDRPEAISLIIEEYRREILFYVADSNKKPKIWSPEQYLEYLRITVEFLFDEEIIAPCCKPEMWEKYRAKYGNTPIEAIELIVAMCVKEAYWEDEDFIGHIRDAINSKKSFRKACEEMFDINGIRITKERLDMLCEDAKELYEDIKGEEEGFTLKEAYKDTFNHYFAADLFEDIYMYDCDYLSYFDGYDFAEKGGLDKYLSELADMSSTGAA